MSSSQSKKKRITIQGHYRVIERDEKGRFVTAKKWSPKKDVLIIE